MTIQELKKAYKLSENQMKQIRDAMEIAYKSIQIDMPGRQSSFEHRIEKIVGADEGNWYIAEDFAQAFYAEHKWPEVFLDFYSSDAKFKSFLNNEGED